MCLQLCLNITPAFGTGESYKNPFTTGALWEPPCIAQTGEILWARFQNSSCHGLGNRCNQNVLELFENKGSPQKIERIDVYLKKKKKKVGVDFAIKIVF